MTFPTCEQKEIVFAPTGKLFVRACPGAGKTRVIAERFLWRGRQLAKNRGIALLSFTNAAADEIRNCCAEHGTGQLLRFPNFVGTIDSFISTYLVVPFGIGGAAQRPRIVESWDRWGIRVRLRRKGERQPWGMSLDALVYENDGTESIALERIEQQAGVNYVRANLEAFKTEARRRHTSLLQKGYLSCADARHFALQRIRDPHQGQLLGAAMSGRFVEILIDEAQDCNDEDLEIITWLKGSGISTVIVCDPDQEVFEFRTGCSPKRLEEGVRDHVEYNLTGNFRSTPAICRAAATLRGNRKTPDSPLGGLREDGTPLYVLPYSARRIGKDLGEAFLDLIRTQNCSVERCRAIAHKTKDAARSVGVTDPDERTESTARQLALAVADYRSASSTGSERLHALREAERVVLMRFATSSEALRGEDPEKLALTLGIRERWLKSVANSLLSRLSAPKNNTSGTGWVSGARELLNSIPDPPGVVSKQNAGTFLRVPRASRASLVPITSPLGIPFSSIHKAKGQQFEAVMFVIPPNSASSPSGALIRNWQLRRMEEPNRVAYVAITRAQRLLLIAVPSDLRADLCSILSAGDVPLQVLGTNTRHSSQPSFWGEA